MKMDAARLRTGASSVLESILRIVRLRGQIGAASVAEDGLWVCPCNRWSVWGMRGVVKLPPFISRCVLPWQGVFTPPPVD